MVAGLELSGIIGACLTPFDDSGRINYDALEREIDFIVADADAISIGAVEAAEYTMLSTEERKELNRRATEMVAGRVPLILGASAPSPREVLGYAEHAATLGADLIQVLMPLRPWGGQPTMNEIVQYYTEIASRSPLPIVAYHNPGPGADPSVDTTIKLSEIYQIQCFKESSREVTKILRLIEEIDRAGNARYFTTMQPLLVTLDMGGSGGTMPPPGTRIGAQVVKAFREGDIDRAKAWQRYYSLFPAKWAAYGLPPVMKSAMKHFGIDLGEPSRPYRSVSPSDHAQIGQFLQQTGLLDGALPDPSRLQAAIAGLSREDTFIR
jgi:4-hydroxy-tetrahydrodipicolinate synthase